MGLNEQGFLLEGTPVWEKMEKVRLREPSYLKTNLTPSEGEGRKVEWKLMEL